ncbi:MAG: hypothetical protein CL878_13605 [Dehalococcoidia bacterium]|nr:hypothetical protein [Dehalococcoidia bacterium]
MTKQYYLWDYDELRCRQDWRGILIGNGASMAVSSRFGYKSLYRYAVAHGKLGKEDRRLFRSFNTTNFEAVLSALSTAKVVNDILGLDTTLIETHKMRIMAALVESVSGVHIGYESVPEDTLERIRCSLNEYRFVFTTNYDLLTYWCINFGDDPQHKDFFWTEEVDDSIEFAFGDTDVAERAKRIYWLHGALHIYREAGLSSRDLKRVNDSTDLLTKFGEPLGNDAVPLLVTEGSSEWKMDRIKDASYLSFCYEAFRQFQESLVIFGHSLSDTDRHIVKAMRSRHCESIAVSIRLKPNEGHFQDMDGYRERLDRQDIWFFDASSHPLGNPANEVGD